MTAAAYSLKVTTGQLLPGGPPVTVAAVAGEVDTTNAAAFRAAAEQLATDDPTILDLSDLTYLDSAGFAALHHLLADRPVAAVLPARSPLSRAAVLMSLPHSETVEAAAAVLDAARPDQGARE
jgi:hypothetical protein